MKINLLKVNNGHKINTTKSSVMPFTLTTVSGGQVQKTEQNSYIFAQPFWTG